MSNAIRDLVRMTGDAVQVVAVRSPVGSSEVLATTELEVTVRDEGALRASGIDALVRRRSLVHPNNRRQRAG